ncbi:glycosyltransferase [Cellulomonas soli]
MCVVYHPGEELEEFARSLQQASGASVELVIVDNGDDHDVSAAVADQFGARLVVAPGNLGYGGGANLGAAGCQAPWLVVANSDLVWQPGSLDALLAAGEQHPRAGALGPALLNMDGTVYPSARELPSLRQGVGHAVFARLWPANPWTRAYQARQERVGEARTAGWLSGACLLLRAEAFGQVHGFDEDYFMFFEDVDLGDRLGQAGWTNLYVPAARVVHVGGRRGAPSPPR